MYDELNFSGLIPATVLPMTKNGEADEIGLRRYIRWISKQGIVGVAINVDTGEAAHLTQAEKLRVLEVVREELPPTVMLVAGVSGPYTAAAVSQAVEYKSVGADALLVFPIPAYLSAPLDPAIPYRYHASIASVGLPMILFQLQPALGGVSYSREVLERLLDIDMVAAVKEASFDARRFIDTVGIVRDMGRPIALLTGNDNFIYESFILGAEGALIGFGAVMTAEQVELIRLTKIGDFANAKPKAKEIQCLADAVFAAPVANYRARLKEILVMQGLLDEAHVREPLIPIANSERESLRKVLVNLGLLAR